MNFERKNVLSLPKRISEVSPKLERTGESVDINRSYLPSDNGGNDSGSRIDEPGIASRLEEIHGAASDQFDSFQTYVIPVASTDRIDLDRIDPRLVDRVWRLNNLYYVVNEDGEMVKFKLRAAQEKLLRGMHYKNIILKARQLGFTTFICIFLLDYALFNSNKQIGIIAQTAPDATVIFRKIKLAWDNFSQELKDFLGLRATGDSKIEYEFTNNSVMRISTSLRSGTYQAVLITEFGKICAKYPEKAEEIITGTLPAVPKNGLIFIESTAEGEDGSYYEMVQEAIVAHITKRVLTMKEYKFFFFPWYENPEDFIEGDVPMDMKTTNYLDKVEEMNGITLTKEQRSWYYITAKEQKAKMKQENPSSPDEAFLVSGNKLFDGAMLDLHQKQFSIQPIEETANYRIFRKFRKGHVYGLGADVSLGVLKDSSTIVIIDFTTNEVVFTYRSNDIDPVSFAADIKKWALEYGGCIAAPEANNVGITTCIQLAQIYTNIYTQVRQGMVDDHPSQKLGWLTSAATKPKMMYELSEAVGDSGLQILDELILREAKRFNKEDSLTVTDVKSTRHFDLLIACAIAWQMRIYASRGIGDQEQAAAVEHLRQERKSRSGSIYR